MSAFLRHTLITGLAALTVISPASALVTLGHGRLVGTAVLRVDYDSNIFVSNPDVDPLTNRPRPKKDGDDYIATATAELRYVRDAGLVKLDAGVGVAAMGFANHSDQNTADPYFDSHLGYNPSDKTDVQMGLSLRRSSIANEQVNVRTESNDLNLDGQIEHLPSEKLGFRLTGSYRRNDYVTKGYSDIESYSAGANVVHIYSEKLKFLAGVTATNWSTSAATPGSDVDTVDMRYTVGAEGELTPKINGDVSVGYVQRNADTRGLKDTGSMFIASRVSWAAAEKTSIILTATQDYSLSAANQSVRALNLGLGVNHSFTQKLSFDGNIGYDRSGYTGVTAGLNRRDTGYSIRARLNYVMSNALSADISTGYRDSNSTSAISDYERFNFGAGVTVRF